MSRVTGVELLAALSSEQIDLEQPVWVFIEGVPGAVPVEGMVVAEQQLGLRLEAGEQGIES